RQRAALSVLPEAAWVSLRQHWFLPQRRTSGLPEAEEASPLAGLLSSAQALASEMMRTRRLTLRQRVKRCWRRRARCRVVVDVLERTSRCHERVARVEELEGVGSRRFAGWRGRDAEV